MKMTPQQIRDGLAQHYCTDGYTRYTFGILMTSGVKWLCDAAQSYWLVDATGSYQNSPKVKNDESLQGIQFWTLKVNTEKKTAVLILECDTDDVVLTQNIEYTDFPLDEIKLYYSPADRVLLLPSEY
jgi:hypothetical protein